MAGVSPVCILTAEASSAPRGVRPSYHGYLAEPRANKTWTHAVRKQEQRHLEKVYAHATTCTDRFQEEFRRVDHWPGSHESDRKDLGSIAHNAHERDEGHSIASYLSQVAYEHDP